ncbi:protein jag [Aphanothece sacrum]|uniref:DNA-binding protein n=1 Tax=Aphanothece sacrum FPU1 TaxID=1920663 RepID=A0A401IMJ3_APHSA|nr:R3H domain-containing nucleic acid-binding protein [Aphanothece sacrum]GBF82463.1 DNA-binding protein [Aphanothece sacrum FPU1]GBF84382.1 DNA-binding protein [Aphanothece sacrum FPU3]
MEQQGKPGKEWLETLLKLMGLPAEVKLDYRSNGLSDSDECWLIINDNQLKPEQIALLLGNGGEGLDAIQYLANTLINLSVDSSEQQGFTVELCGYRLKRQEELKIWVQQIAQQVRQTGREIEMSSLSSAERRQIHSFLQDSPDLETESRGQEPDRRLVIKPR